MKQNEIFTLIVAATVCMAVVLFARYAQRDPEYIEVEQVQPESEITPQEASESVTEPIEEQVQEPVAEVYEEYYEPVYYPTEGLTPSGGVNYYNGRKETYYSSAVLYHYRTPEWWIDDEGFYRTEDGYYVVATSDMEQGTVFEGSKGMCQVLDCGCAEGTTDYYVGPSWN